MITSVIKEAKERKKERNIKENLNPQVSYGIIIWNPKERNNKSIIIIIGANKSTVLIIHRYGNPSLDKTNKHPYRYA